MKKIIILSFAVMMCLFMLSCSKAELADNTALPQEESTYAEDETSTTEAPADDSEKAKALKSTMTKILGTDNKTFDVSSDGSFEYSLKSFNEIELYSAEYSDEIEKYAYENIDNYIDAVKTYYPDSEQIKLYTKNTKQISYGDNGIDSVYYNAVYINTQNQKITVYADSTGELYYAKCDFTW